MTTRFKLRRDLAATWTTTNPILAAGEPGLETDTRKVKYGDGTTRWNNLNYSAADGGTIDTVSHFQDGINDNVWRTVTVSGTKEFDYEIKGYKYITATATQTYTDSSTFTLSLSAHPLLTEVSRTWNFFENEINLYQGNETSGNSLGVSNMQLADGVATFTTYGTFSAAAGDTFTVEYFWEGSIYSGSNFDSNGDFFADQFESELTNTVRIDTNEYNNWLPWSVLNEPAKVANSAIRFKGWENNDWRNMVSAVNLGNGIYTITFDGAPRQTKTAELKTITTNPLNSGDGSVYLDFSETLFPEFDREVTYPPNTETNKYTGGTNRSGYLTINGGDPIDFSWYNDHQYYNNTRNYRLYLSSDATWSTTDTVVIHYYTRTDTIEIELYNPNPSNWNDGVKWFDWKDDIEEFYPRVGNGIVQGRGMVSAKMYYANNDDTDFMSYNFGWKSDTSNYFSDPRDPYSNDTVWNMHQNDMYFISDFDDTGIVADYNGTRNGYRSEIAKVRIIYKFELVVAEGYGDGWFNC